MRRPCRGDDDDVSRMSVRLPTLQEEAEETPGIAPESRFSRTRSSELESWTRGTEEKENRIGFYLILPDA